MPDNGAGAYSLPLTLTPDTDATAEDMNTLFGDIATALTNRIAADGQTTVTNQIKGFSGSVAAPGYAWSNDLDTGLYRIGANNVGISCGGAKALDIAATAASVPGTFTSGGALTVTTGGITITAGDFIATAGDVTLTTGDLTVSDGDVAVTGKATIDVADADALAVGANGATNPALQVDTSASSAATGVKVTAAAAASGVAVAVISTGTDESLTIDAKGAGTITLNGTGTGNVTSPRGITSTGTAGIGYAAGAGGTVTQSTSKSTGVTLDKTTGQITMNNAALAAGAEVAFTLTNAAIASTDVVVVCVASGGTSAAYGTFVTAVGSGSCEITVSNLSAASKSEALVLNFVVIKGVAA